MQISDERAKRIGRLFREMLGHAVMLEGRWGKYGDRHLGAAALADLRDFKEKVESEIVQVGKRTWSLKEETE